MRKLAIFSFVALIGSFASCDGTPDASQSNNPDPPRLVRITVQDEPGGAGRHIVTDVLDQAKPAACDDTHPCVNTGYPSPNCAIPSGQTSGLCPDPLSDNCATPVTGNTLFGPTYDSCTATSGPRPVYIGEKVQCGGNAIRLVLSKTLDPSFGVAVPAGAVELDGPDGMPIAPCAQAPSGGLFYDASGLPVSSSNPVTQPFGPAIVIVPSVALAPSTTYTIKIDPTKIVDASGRALVAMTGDAIAAGYPFTTEAAPH